MIKYAVAIILSFNITEEYIRLQYSYIMIWPSYLIIILGPG